MNTTTLTVKALAIKYLCTKNIIIFILSIIILASASAFSFVLGGNAEQSRHISDSLDTSKPFKDGLKLGEGRQAWVQAAESHMHLTLINSDRDNKEEMLRGFLIDNMWLSVIRLEEFIHNEDAPSENRAAASRTLAKIVGYFKKHPKKIEKPEGTNLAEELDKGLGAKLSDDEMDAQEKDVLAQIRDKAKGPMTEMENTFDDLLHGFYRRDLKTQAVIDRLIKERHLPGNKHQFARITFWVPKSNSTSSGSDNEFEFSGIGIEVIYREGILTMNGIEYGKLTKGDIAEEGQRGQNKPFFDGFVSNF